MSLKITAVQWLVKLRNITAPRCLHVHYLCKSAGILNPSALQLKQAASSLA